MLITEPMQPVNYVLKATCVGKQHLGYSSGGALDQLSLLVAYWLLTGKCLVSSDILPNSAFPNSMAIEIVVADRVTAQRSAQAVMVGAFRSMLRHRGDQVQRVAHGEPFELQRGDCLRWGRSEYGHRSYLVVIDLGVKDQAASDDSNGSDSKSYVNEWQKAGWGNTLSRDLRGIWSWSKRGIVRVVKGPEYEQFDYAQLLQEALWQVDARSNRMGMRLNWVGSAELFDILTNKTAEKVAGEKCVGNDRPDMVSQPVNDGTVQFTPMGPIILLRDRQTVGGYPRFLNVIEADLDLLAHYRPGQVLRFEMVSIEQAIEILTEKRRVIRDTLFRERP